MFIGEFTHSIDLKGRVSIPYRFRKDLGDGGVITKGTDDCLVIYTKTEWEKVASKLADLPMFDPKAKALTRFIFSSAAEVDFDSQGRALLPQFLRDFADLGKDVIIAGVYNKIEIWSIKNWKNQQEKVGVGSEKFEKDLQSLGI